MNEHTIVNTIFVVIAIAVFVVQAYRKIAGAPPAAGPGPEQPRRPLIVPNVTGPAAAALGQARQRLVRQLTAAPNPPPTPQPMRAEAPARPLAAPAASRAPVAQRPPAAARPLAVEALGAFPVLDLTLPDAEVPGRPAPRRRGRSMLGTGVPGSPAWGAGAIVALEILGPPVSLRAGATLGAPHAF
jgi:hypothetical protein